MTRRDFFKAIIEANMNDEINEFARDALAQMDKTNEKRRATMAEKAVEKAAEKAPLREAIVACLTDEPKTATMLIAEAGVEMKPQAIPSLLKGLVEDGTVVKGEVKIKGKGKQVGYARG